MLLEKETNKMKVINKPRANKQIQAYRLPLKTIADLKQLAKANKVSQAVVIEQLVNEAMNK